MFLFLFITGCRKMKKQSLFIAPLKCFCSEIGNWHQRIGSIFYISKQACCSISQCKRRDPQKFVSLYGVVCYMPFLSHPRSQMICARPKFCSTLVFTICTFREWGCMEKSLSHLRMKGSSLRIRKFSVFSTVCKAKNFLNFSLPLSWISKAPFTILRGWKNSIKSFLCFFFPVS